MASAGRLDIELDDHVALSARLFSNRHALASDSLGRAVAYRARWDLHDDTAPVEMRDGDLQALGGLTGLELGLENEIVAVAFEELVPLLLDDEDDVLRRAAVPWIVPLPHNRRERSIVAARFMQTQILHSFIVRCERERRGEAEASPGNVILVPFFQPG